MAEKVRIVLYAKNECGLCNEMKDQMRQANCEELYTLEEVDIEQDAESFTKYRYEIPVLCINGVEAFRHRLSSSEFYLYLKAISEEIR